MDKRGKFGSDFCYVGNPDTLGGCCCTCRWLAEDFSHPDTDGGQISTRIGFICMAPEFVDETTGRGHFFSGWDEHGFCEMYDQMRGSKS